MIILGQRINEIQQRGPITAVTTAVSGSFALYNVYVFSKIALLPSSLSLATLGVLILKITKRTEKNQKTLPLQCTAIHLFDVKHLKRNLQNYFPLSIDSRLCFSVILNKGFVAGAQRKDSFKCRKRYLKTNVIWWQNL